MKKLDLERLQEAHDDLKSLPCTFFICSRPKNQILNMKTCKICSARILIARVIRDNQGVK